MAARDTKLYSFLFEALVTQAKRHRNHQPLLGKFSSEGYSLGYPTIYKWSRRIFPKIYYSQADEAHPESKDEANLELAELIAHDYENPSVDKNNDPLAPFRSDEHGQVEALESDKTHQEFEKELAEEKTQEEAKSRHEAHTRESIHAGSHGGSHLPEQPTGLPGELTEAEKDKLKHFQSHPDVAHQTAVPLTDVQKVSLGRLKTHPDAIAAQKALQNITQSNLSKNAQTGLSILIKRLLSRFLPAIMGALGGFGVGELLGGPAIGFVTGTLGGVIAYRASQMEYEEVEEPQQAQQPSGSSGSPNLSLLKRLLGRSGTRAGGGLVRAGASTAAKRGLFALIAANPEIWIPALVVIGVVILIPLLYIIINQFNRNTSLFPPFTQPTQNTTAQVNISSSSDIAQCSFYGASGPQKIGNPDLATVINDVAGQVGIPASVLAGIMRIESPSAFTSNDPSYLTNDYDATVSSAGAIGVTQFLPSTFQGIFYSNSDILNNLFGKTSVDVSIPDQTYPPPSDSVFRITSIHDEIVATALKIKADKASAVGDGADWSADAVRAVAQSYQGACPYGGNTIGNYCDDLASSFTNCTTGSTFAGTGPAIAVNLVNQISQFCNRQVINYQTACIDNNTPPIDARAQSEIDYNVGSFNGNLQCVGFVQAVVNTLYSQPMARVGNAVDYAYNPVPGYQFIPDYTEGSSTPQPGDLAVWNMQPFGHIAYIISVESPDIFTVAEANYAGPGRVTADRHVSKSDSYLVGWLRKQ